MLERVHIRNFKAIRDATVDLDRFTVIVGPNSSGKTSILQAIYCLDFTYEKKPKLEGFLEGSEWLHKGGGDQLEVDFTSTAWQVGAFSAKLGASSESGEEFRQFEWATKSNGNARAAIHFGAGAIPSVVDDPRPIPVTRFLAIDSRQLAYPNPVTAGSPLLNPAGGNLSAALAYVNLNLPDEFDRLNELLRKVVPSIRRVRFRRVQQFKTFLGASLQGVAEELLFDTASGTGIPARFVSEGTLLILAVLTAIAQVSGPTILLLDGMELSLHPAAQAEVVRTLRTLLDQLPDLQIVATSHSPYLVDSLDPSELRLTLMTDEGDVICGKLTDHPDFDRWKDEMSPGELWGMWGESWLQQAKTGAAAT